MAYTRVQWSRIQQSLPTEDRMTYEEYLESLNAQSDAGNAARIATRDADAAELAALNAQANAAVAEAQRLEAEADASAPKPTKKFTNGILIDGETGAPFNGVHTDGKTYENGKVVETKETVEIEPDPTPVEKIFGPSQFSKDGRELEFKPITEGARLAIFGLNPATGKAYTDAESAALNGGYLPEGYKNLKGYRFDPVTGALEVLGGNGTTSGLGTGYTMNAKGNILPNQSRLPKGVGIDENGKYYQPGEVMPNESLQAYAGRMTSIGGSGNFVYKGKNYLFDQKGEYYIPGEQDMPFGFGTPNNVPGMLPDGTMSNTATISKGLVTGTSTNTLKMNLPTGVTVTTTYVDPATGSTIGVLSNGTTRVLTQGNTQETARQSTLAVLTDRFNKYGLASLAGKIRELAITGATEATITLQLQETQEYQQRFAANNDRIKKGLQVLSPSDYLNTEDSYRQVLRAYGLKQFDNDAYVRQFIANDMSPTELSNRVVTAVQRVQNADPAIISQLKQYYGIGVPDMVAYVLDPEQQFQKIERQIAASEIGVAAGRQGLQAGVSVAEQLAAQGVSQAQAQKGYATIADILPTAEKLSGIYGSTMDTYGQSEGEQEVFNSLASAQRKRQRLSAAETGTFGGSAGMNRVSLTSEKSAGQI